MAKAQAKFVRMSPRKIRRVVNMVRGKEAVQAQTVLKFMPYAAARVVEKVLKSAISNAKENESLSPDELRITKAYVDQSTTLRRWRAMSRGRGYPILKRTSHVTIEVTPDATLVRQAPRKMEQSPSHKHKHEHVHEEEHKHVHKVEKPASPKMEKTKEHGEKKEKVKKPRKRKEDKE